MHNPRIVSEKSIRLSDWVQIVERAVELEPGQTPEVYHSLGQADYVAILAITPEGTIPIVRQFRPGYGHCTWELPAGHVDPQEDPENSCVRELREETGFTARQVYPLGISSPCTLRLSNRLHAFFVEAEVCQADFQPEKGMDVKNVAPKELLQMILTGEFPLQLHVGVILRAALDPVVAPKLGLKLRVDSEG
ncbi:MAG TPA: NUDIX hydrolase [Terriglobales bacterium]|jgi:ADP-ribose pyrophosphatase|nr:NUDIX hydrolase [Terriglobales bacterium]